jgi:hypothetical protein
MEEWMKNEGIKSWIPGTSEFKAANAIALKKAREEDIEYKQAHLEELEKMWRETIQKADKSWGDSFILSNIGVRNEKELDKLMDELRTHYLKNSKTAPPGTKETFIQALLRMISLLPYL